MPIFKSQRSKSTNKRRKGKLAFVIPWARRFGFAIALAIFTFWIGSWLYLGGHVERATDWAGKTKNEALASVGFSLKNILLEGRINASAETVMALINMQKGDPLFSFDPKSAREQIGKMAWIENVQIERRWPDTIYIRLKERTPLAFLQSNKKLLLLDQHGQIIHTNNLSRFEDLIIVIGEGAQEKSPQLLATLKAEPEIFSRVESAKRISDRRWDVVLKNNMTLKLPENDYALALRQISDAQKEDQILDKDIEHIDLRDHARMIIRTRPGMVQEYKASLKPGENI
ncbi:FtsQ-type POTRA domain-containing protein [Alphaproteobacteria bacterium]|nr:FtsQ-type POTRA domain-containing protein [Alphaproteobacteria bacterium]